MGALRLRCVWRHDGVEQDGVGKAVAPLRKAIELAPAKADLLCDLAACLMGLDETKEPHELLQAAITSAPGLAQAHGNLGALYLRLGHLLAAEAATRRAVELAPGEHRWIANLAVVAKFNANRRLA